MKNGKVSVVNVKREVKGSYEYIGRRNVSYGLEESVLKNRFVVGVDGKRGECVEKFRIEFKEKLVNKDEKIWNELMRLVRILKSGKDVKLGCWCKVNGNESCHGDIIKLCLEWLVERE